MKKVIIIRWDNEQAKNAKPIPANIFLIISWSCMSKSRSKSYSIHLGTNKEHHASCRKVQGYVTLDQWIWEELLYEQGEKARRRVDKIDPYGKTNGAILWRGPYLFTTDIPIWRKNADNPCQTAALKEAEPPFDRSNHARPFSYSHLVACFIYWRDGSWFCHPHPPL